MKGLVEAMKEYYSCQQKPLTKMLHYAAIPLIYFSLLIALGWIHLTIPNVIDLHFAWIATLLLLVYYFFIDWQLALGATVIFLLVNFLAGFISQPAPTGMTFMIFLVLLVAGSAAALVGHFTEGKKQLSMSCVMNLLNAPLFMVAELFVKFGQRTELKKEMK